MLKRAIIFTTPARLSLSNRQLVMKDMESSEEIRRLPVEDLGILVIENQQISMSIPLMNALTENDAIVVFCNSKGMPASMLTNMDGNITQGETLRNQIACGEVLKKQLWKQIVEAKIRNQSLLLEKVGCGKDPLKFFHSTVKSGDADNREGIAARMYFLKLFGKDFVRDKDAPGINAMLNYGYTVLRAAVSRAIVASGLFPAIGIFHHNRSNAFPLADDLMEPYRPYIDEIVYRLAEEGKTELDKETKSALVMSLYNDTQFPKVVRPLSVGLSMTTASLVKCYSKEESKISFPVMR